MEILILCGIYLVELACYCLGLRILFEVHYRTKVWMALGILVPVVVGVLPIDDSSGKNILLAIVVASILVISLEGKIIENGIRLILILILVECIDDFFVHSCEYIVIFLESEYMRNLNYLITKCCTTVSIFLLKIIKEKINYRKTHINSVIYFLIGIIAFLMIFCLSILNQVIVYMPDKNYIILCDLLNIFVYIGILLLVIFVIYIKNTHERMERLLKTEQLLKESQVNYYKQILKKETDTRKYRHDMVNHLVYLQDILSRNKINDAQKYLLNMLGVFKKIQNTYYVTGNEMLDTIMNYFFGMLPENVVIEIKGRCPVDIAITDTDVCTIFSNLFQNAVEEIVENSIENAKIIIEVLKGNKYVEYKVINSISYKIDESIIDKNGLPRSHKIDKRNHGIGMINVKEAVEKNGGCFDWSWKDGYFCVDVVLPLK